jgi:hypothetical protein
MAPIPGHAPLQHRSEPQIDAPAADASVHDMRGSERGQSGTTACGAPALASLQSADLAVKCTSAAAGELSIQRWTAGFARARALIPWRQAKGGAQLHT